MSKRKHDDEDNITSNIDNNIKITVDDLTCLTCQIVTNNIDSNISQFQWATRM